jgi:membrane associated rhomboid family serine protease
MIPGAPDLESWLGLVPAMTVHGAVWQPFTYMFLHSPLDPFHILLNMLVLWMFGGELERHWGGRRYLTFYLVCGVGAALFVVAQAFVRASIAPLAWGMSTIGASGAIYGIILAYGITFAERTVLFMMIFPMRARTMTWILFAIAFFSNFSQARDRLSHIAHLGGMVVGWLYLKRAWRIGDLIRDLRWKIKRRRFKVTRPGDDDRWIH